MKFTFTEEDKMCKDCMVCEKLEFINRIHRCGASNQPIAGYSRCPHLDERVIKKTKLDKFLEILSEHGVYRLLGPALWRRCLIDAGYEPQPDPCDGPSA